MQSNILEEFVYDTEVSFHWERSTRDFVFFITDIPEEVQYLTEIVLLLFFLPFPSILELLEEGFRLAGGKKKNTRFDKIEWF